MYKLAAYSDSSFNCHATKKSRFTRRNVPGGHKNLWKGKAKIRTSLFLISCNEKLTC